MGGVNGSLSLEMCIGMWRAAVLRGRAWLIGVWSMGLDAFAERVESRSTEGKAKFSNIVDFVCVVIVVCVMIDDNDCVMLDCQLLVIVGKCVFLSR
jgi:hypothetical protein